MTMSSNDNPSSLEEQARQRREKLLSLKRKRDGKTNSNGSNSELANELAVLPRPSFRSYKPIDENLHENLLPSTQPEDVSTQVKDQLESANTKIVLDQLDVTSLAPRKPDWDLKRDIAKRIEQVERQTQRAIAELIRERLKERKEDLASMVNVGTTENFDR
ncbi:coiled-coil domain-containing protein 12 [Sitophilus oryzae]|uniref:Coiled-coil domain-containing protein 12 n=1 Tax=Sitophilus oryzae TaxID=7048 RepID=A0A6J2YFJ7_SITOR|nr:coiled-coil domain-containing protein 12 [Sitophilus oryzae]